MYDIIIVGAGPAGLTAALYALRANKTVLLLEKSNFGGQMTFSPKIENYPGFKEISGTELADSLFDQVLEQGADFELEEVLSVTDNGIEKVVKTDSGEHTAKAVIIASGAKHRMLGVPNEEKFVGEGVSFCAVCDGAFYAGKDVIVVGGGNSALQEAALLSDVCKSVTVIQNLAYLTGEGKLAKALNGKPNVKIIYNTVIKEFTGESALQGAVIKKTQTGEETEITFDGAFVAIGLAPENKPFEALAELDSFGYIKSDEACLTKTEGIFTAGDCRTKKIRQITTATADGAVAALAACSYVDEMK